MEPGHRRRSNRLAWLLVSVAAALAGLPAFADPGQSDRAAPTASQLLPAHLRAGPFHRVEERVETDGFTHVFSVHSEFGDFRVHGGDVLLHLVAEIEALAFLLEREEEDEFTQAAGRVGPLPSADLLEEHADFAASQRALAHALGVDPYTETQSLREALHRFAWLVAVGGLPLPVADPARSPAHGANERVHGLLRDHAEEDLERLNRIELAVMGVSEEVREAFLDHPEYSAHHETALVDALAAMEDTEERDDFIGAALSAESPAEARRYRRVAEMLRDYHEDTAALDSIEILGGHPTALSVEGVRVAPVRSDHATWTPHVERFAARVLEAGDALPGDADDAPGEAVGEGPAADGEVHLLFEGSLSEQARERLEAMGHRVDSQGAPWVSPVPGTSETSP